MNQNKIISVLEKIGRYIINLFIVSNPNNDINQIPPASTIIRHFGVATVIGNDVEIKENVFIMQNVRIEAKNKKSPVIEENVTIRSNAKIIGDLTIGHDSVIGAGAVVLEDVPPYSLAVGSPARIIEGKYKEDKNKDTSRIINGKYENKNNSAKDENSNNPSKLKNFKLFWFFKYLIKASNSHNLISCEIPTSTKFRYSGKGVVIGSDVKIGENVLIGDKVTIGARKEKSPIIEKNVTICSDAVIIGNVTVGHDSFVEEGAVVLDDVPPNSSVTGIPAQIIKDNEK